jgi:uncharacterized protein YyaL (SSP411 family)
MPTPSVIPDLPGAEPFPEDLRQKLSVAPSLADGAARFTNRLLLEESPYLRQHAHNPVSWFPWGEEAFEEARRLGRPIFLSVGYSTCHWCHVMERESFEDLEIAAFLNRHYVAVKVDREERPDVDAVYMSAVQQLTGSGGWPMSVWLTPEREPFFGGTYFPPRDGARGARHGFLTLLRELHETYRKEPERVDRAARSLVEAVRRDMEGTPEGGAGRKAEGDGEGELDAIPGRQSIERAVDYFKRAFDATYGGLRRAPKFPSNVPIRLLLRHYHRTHDVDALNVALVTLEKMASGGLYDQLAGGFHRYSTDAEWLVPHFEKMLYDNALLVVAYVEAYQLTGQPFLARVARETCDYVLREMTAAGGGFFSATDADSEGVEGKFFVWTEGEIREVLTREALTVDGLDPHGDLETFLQHYDVTPEGNWEGTTILRVLKPNEELWQRLGRARALLYAHRLRRVPPSRDEKILGAWNGLMISALAVAGRVLGEARYTEGARRAADFVLEHMRDPRGDVVRSFKSRAAEARTSTSASPSPSASPGLGFLDDFAFVTAGLIDLYQATFEPRYLREALGLADATERHFADRGGGWFMTGASHEVLIARERPAYDGAEPSGASVALMNALRLGTYTDDPRWRAIAERGFRSLAHVLGDRSVLLTEALLALDTYWDEPLEIALVWPEAQTRTAAAPFLSALARTYLRSSVLAGGSPSELAALGDAVPFVRGKVTRANHVTAYVCRHGTCALPTDDPDTFQAQLAGVTE